MLPLPEFTESLILVVLQRPVPFEYARYPNLQIDTFYSLSFSTSSCLREAFRKPYILLASTKLRGLITFRNVKHTQ